MTPLDTYLECKVPERSGRWFASAEMRSAAGDAISRDRLTHEIIVARVAKCRVGGSSSYHMMVRILLS